MRACYEVVERMGGGAVYLGSARVPEDHPHFQHAKGARQGCGVGARLHDVVGPGSGYDGGCDAGRHGGGQARGGVHDPLEAGGQRQASRKHPYLPDENYLTTSFFSARKHGRGRGREEHAGRSHGVLRAPGGVGTLDEIFEVLALLQLRRIGSAHPVPFVVMNYDGCYDGLLQFLERDMVRYGSLREHELAPHWRACVAPTRRRSRTFTSSTRRNERDEVLRSTHGVH